MVMTGPLDFFTTSRSGDNLAPNFGAPASFSACAARASGVQARAVITAAAPMTALRMRKDRRSMFEESADASGKAGDGVSFLGEVFIWCLQAEDLFCDPILK